MIHIENLHKSYNHLEVIKGIDLDIAKGDITALYGASGSGKTTLLNIIGTFDTADQGFIRASRLKRYYGDRNYKITSKGKRCINLIIDEIFVGVIILIFASILLFLNQFYPFVSIILETNALKWILINLIGFTAHFLYYVPLEYRYRTTIGKLLTGTYVIKNDGLYPARDTIINRTISRLFPFEPLSVLFSKKGLGWHDRISETIVIEKKSSKEYLNKLDLNKIKTEDELASFRNLSIGYIFQFHNLMPEFNVLENICIPGYFSGKQKDEVDKQGIELLSVLGLSDKVNNMPDELSGGEQQRVAVARALINQPDIVLADEPAGSLDAENSEKLHQIFMSLRDRYKTTFLIATHDPKLSKISDKVYWIKDGAIIS